MTAAYQVGFDFATTVRETFSKNCRKEALRAAGLEVTNVTAEEFAAGHAAGVASLEPAKAAAAARDAELAAKHDALHAACFAGQSHRNEELHSYAARKRAEWAGMVEAPAAVLSMIAE